MTDKPLPSSPVSHEREQDETPQQRAEHRIYKLADRGKHICPSFQHSDERAISCAICGYTSDVHLIRDLLLVKAESPAQETGEAQEPAGWYCGCGWANGLNLAVCGMCGRNPQDGLGVTFYKTKPAAVSDLATTPPNCPATKYVQDAGVAACQCEIDHSGPHVSGDLAWEGAAAVSDPLITALREYGQHKSWCSKGLPVTPEGPWAPVPETPAPHFTCTCGFDALLSSLTDTPGSQEQS
jgi:hypothetical protein